MGTLGSLKMSISSRRNIDFHVLHPRKCDLETGTRQHSKKLSFWKDFGLHFCDFFFLKRVLKSSRKKTRKKVSKKLKRLFFGVAPAECAVAGERLERGQKSKIAGSWKTLLERVFQVIICQLLDFNPARSSLPYGKGGGTLCAFRRPILDD